MTARFWFVPCWSGDFRIEKASGGRSMLTVESPTAGDIARLAPFLVKLREAGHLPPEAGIAPTGKTALVLPLSVVVAGQILATACSDADQTWTAIRYTSGGVEVVDGSTLPQDKAADVEAAATIKKPVRGCPEPEAAARRASTVLRAFTTARQWEGFQADGYLRATGNATGKLYRIYHADEAARRGLSRALTTEDGEVVCAHDESVPAEEQALALKLAVEHREAWLLRMEGDRVLFRCNVGHPWT